MRFEFATAQRVIFGSGAFQELTGLARALGKRPLVVTGQHPERFPELMAALTSQGLTPTLLPTSGEPSVGSVCQGAQLAAGAQVDLVIAIGGGSVLDAGKAVAALAVNPGDPMQHLEVVGLGRPLVHPPLPIIAVPTTAGTGSEVTRNAVLTSPEHGMKVSLRHEWMLPRVALVDPELTYELPPDLTASTGLDALTQLIEPYLSLRANPLTDALCLEGLMRASRSLSRAWEDGHDQEAREDMALASLLGGMALANAGLGAVHGLAAPLGGLISAPHGAVCAVLLPHVMEANFHALESSHPIHRKYSMLARILTGQPDASVRDGLRWIQAIVKRFGIPRLKLYGLKDSDMEVIATRALLASSMKANPVKLDHKALVAVLGQAM
jgi:alcohol dehydrogenase class IV